MRLPVLVFAALIAPASVARAVDYYVRQTVGDDRNEGTAPEKAWRSVSKLSSAMHAGDTAYVGPGLYRDTIIVHNDGTPTERITFIADPTGEHTGDPPGVVMITGAEPVDEKIFVPDTAPGVYRAPFPDYNVVGVVEMDGPQSRYLRTAITWEHLQEKMSELDVVAKLPSSYFFDEEKKVLHIHTSDGKPPSTHEIEIMRRIHGIVLSGRHHVTIVGFTFRHQGDAGIAFFEGSSDAAAIHNTAYGTRQGIRVYASPDILVYGNTLFRNENSGVYFAAASANGRAIDNVAYENAKGIRWSSQSNYGLALGNTLFDNSERGISIEETEHMIVRRNVMANNKTSQLLAMIQPQYESDGNCFQNGSPEQLVADLYTERFKALSDYQRNKKRDLASRDGNCGPLPAKADVHALQAESATYAERARKMLEEQKAAPPPAH